MTEPRFSQRSVAALAALVHDIRPAWNEAGVAAELRRHSHLPLAAVAMAIINAACDPKNETPAALSQDGNRAWEFRTWRCAKHPEQRSCRVNGECASCYTDRVGIENAPMRGRGGVPPSPEVRASLLAALRREGATS